VNLIRWDVIDTIDPLDTIDVDPDKTLVGIIDPKDNNPVHINAIGCPSTLLAKRVRADSVCGEICGYRVVKKHKAEETGKENINPTKG
jgi:hypothetical protein